MKALKISITVIFLVFQLTILYLSFNINTVYNFILEYYNFFQVLSVVNLIISLLVLGVFWLKQQNKERANKKLENEIIQLKAKMFDLNEQITVLTKPSEDQNNSAKEQ
ncbi:hypothetical protein [Aureibacter tunicatorum]|uniref:Cell division protein FtsB n=1 Tax=Aureibacter tunicatorum TaxID=866807 RepID=A0AAE4BTC5_9BACT|nr:hypothetical protein [Aureibacter tunicatorum]MDR6239800.1 cell division protein FtsB [Aureibacter tunicatorum]BDD04275.1 hypothetical protein AUTU_17580 [Aureibacter tunicatorum]